MSDPTKLTDAWIAKLNATATESDWNSVAEEIKAAYGGWPTDWFERVVVGAIMLNAQARFAQVSSSMPIELKNGKSEAKPLVAVTMLALEDLITLPIAFYEFVMLCRDRSHKLWPNSVRNIVTAAVTGDGLAMALGSPVK